jgi:hypothetical protein
VKAFPSKQRNKQHAFILLFVAVSLQLTDTTTPLLYTCQKTEKVRSSSRPLFPAPLSRHLSVPVITRYQVH